MFSFPSFLPSLLTRYALWLSLDMYLSLSLLRELCKRFKTGRNWVNYCPETVSIKPYTHELRNNILRVILNHPRTHPKYRAGFALAEFSTFPYYHDELCGFLCEVLLPHFLHLAPGSLSKTAYSMATMIITPAQNCPT